MTFFNFFLALFGLCTSGLLFAAGLLTAFAGLWVLRKELFISKHGRVVPGVVVDIQRKRKRKRTVYDIVVRFPMPDVEHPVTFVGHTGSLWVYQVGQPVRVICMPDDLKSARIDDHWRWVNPCLLIIFGLGFAAVTAVWSVPLISVSH